MAQFNRGAEAIEKAAASGGGGGKFMPVFKFEAGETKYVQILMSIDDVPTVLMHQFIIVGEREDGKPIYERFISRRDPALDGADGYDDLIDRFEVNPTYRSIALAVEVEPVYGAGTGRRKQIEGFGLAERQFERDGETVSVPAFGLIIESPRIFFQDLAVNAEMGKGIEETVWAIRRNGKGKDTSYTFIDTGVEALDVEEELGEFEERFSFDDYLETLADEDRMRELVGELPDDARVSQYGGKKSKTEKEKPARTSSRRARAAVEDEDDAAEEVEEKASAGSKSKRFADLRASTKKSS
jgi:hypothetical protein